MIRKPRKISFKPSGIRRVLWGVFGKISPARYYCNHCNGISAANEAEADPNPQPQPAKSPETPFEVIAAANEFMVVQENSLFVPFGEYPVTVEDPKTGRKVECIQVFDVDAANEIAGKMAGIRGKITGALRLMPIYIGHPDVPQLRHLYPDTKAYGWVTGANVKEGGIEFDVKWGRAGQELIADGQYVFYSPHWPMKPLGAANGVLRARPIGLWSIGLTNVPNIPVPAMAVPGVNEYMGEAEDVLQKETKGDDGEIDAANFDPNQPRDAQGRWTDTDGGGMSWTSPKGAQIKLDGKKLSVTPPGKPSKTGVISEIKNASDDAFAKGVLAKGDHDPKKFMVVRLKTDGAGDVFFAEEQDRDRYEEAFRRTQAYEQTERETFKKNVPGLDELEEEITAEENDFERSRRQIERGTTFSAPRESKVEELRLKYPAAEAYIKARSFSRSSNYMKADAGKKAMERIAAGEPYAQVLADMEKQWSDDANRAAANEQLTARVAELTLREASLVAANETLTNQVNEISAERDRLSADLAGMNEISRAGRAARDQEHEHYLAAVNALVDAGIADGRIPGGKKEEFIAAFNEDFSGALAKLQAAEPMFSPSRTRGIRHRRQNAAAPSAGFLSAVNEAMAQGRTYENAWLFVKRSRPELFSGLDQK